MPPTEPTPTMVMLTARREQIRAKFGGDPCMYMFLDPVRYEQSPDRYIKIDDPDEVEIVRRGWVETWRDRECDIAPEDGRICVIGSLV